MHQAMAALIGAAGLAAAGGGLSILLLTILIFKRFEFGYCDLFCTTGATIKELMNLFIDPVNLIAQLF